MVTILEPRVDTEAKLQLEVESVPVPEDVPQRTGYLEMRYAMPFAGVRYYSFRPSRESTAEYVKPAEPVPAPLAAQLIDERVILL